MNDKLQYPSEAMNKIAKECHNAIVKGCTEYLLEAGYNKEDVEIFVKGRLSDTWSSYLRYEFDYIKSPRIMKFLRERYSN